RGEARRWNCATGQLRREPLPHAGAVRNGDFSRDGRFVLTRTAEKDTNRSEARLWETATGRPVGDPLRHAGNVQTTAFSPDSRIVATGGEDKVSRLWESATG